jgi:hypothetical protein
MLTFPRLPGSMISTLGPPPTQPPFEIVDADNAISIAKADPAEAG